MSVTISWPDGGQNPHATQVVFVGRAALTVAIDASDTPGRLIVGGARYQRSTLWAIGTSERSAVCEPTVEKTDPGWRLRPWGSVSYR